MSGAGADLAFLGARALIRAAVPSGDAFRDDGILDSTGRRRSAFRDGVAVNLLNPPIATFYLAVVPSFMPVPRAGRFALLRFGRIYPLHLFMLLAFAAFELLRLAVPQLGGGGPEPFTGGFDVGSFFSNLLIAA